MCRFVIEIAAAVSHEINLFDYMPLMNQNIKDEKLSFVVC